LVFQSFEDLEVWKRSCQLAVEVYSVCKNWRDFSLKDQMQRSAVSIASNIAELIEETKQISKMLAGLHKSIEKTPR
jgi:hypothetical protein